MRISKAKALRQLSEDRQHYQALKKNYRRLTKDEKESIFFSAYPSSSKGRV